MRRSGRVNAQWETPENGSGFHWEHVAIEVLMDIRAELQKLRKAKVPVWKISARFKCSDATVYNNT